MQARVKTAIVTGANGFIGSHIVYRLLTQGWRVHALGRSDGTIKWDERVGTALGEVGSTANCCGDLCCHQVDFNAPKLALDFLFRNDSSSREAILFHVAGNTRFTPSNPELQRQVNIKAAVDVLVRVRGSIGRAI